MKLPSILAGILLFVGAADSQASRYGEFQWTGDNGYTVKFNFKYGLSRPVVDITSVNALLGQHTVAFLTYEITGPGALNPQYSSGMNISPIYGSSGRPVELHFDTITRSFVPGTSILIGSDPELWFSGIFDTGYSGHFELKTNGNGAGNYTDPSTSGTIIDSGTGGFFLAVPDSGSTLAMAGACLTGLLAMKRRAVKSA